MKIFVEDISEDYGTQGVSVLSLVTGMEFYYAEVRASGITILTDLDEGIEMDDDNSLKKELVAAAFDQTVEWAKEV